MSAIKLCRDCKHLISGEQCDRSPKSPDYVSGKPTGFFMAQSERESMGGCGKEARWFEPKEGA